MIRANGKRLLTVAAVLLLITISVPARAESFDYIAPDSSSRYLLAEEITGWCAQTVCYAKNEIYARHGWIFRSQELSDWFGRQGWYYPSVTSSEFDQSQLNDYERKNALLFQRTENHLAEGGYKVDQPGYSYDPVYTDLYGDSWDSAVPDSWADGCIIPESDSVYLSTDDLLSLTWQELCYARNEIYARHGRLFQSKELRDYFDAKNWYYGFIRPSDFSESVFNSFEKANINTLLEFERTSFGDYPLDSGIYDVYGVRSTLEETSDSSSEFIFPDSNSRYLTESEVSGMTARFLCYAKNEIYARRGRIFNSAELRDYFSSKSWYYGYISPDSFSDSMFNSFEIANIALLQKYEYLYAPGGYQLY